MNCRYIGLKRIFDLTYIKLFLKTLDTVIKWIVKTASAILLNSGLALRNYLFLWGKYKV